MQIVAVRLARWLAPALILIAFFGGGCAKRSRGQASTGSARLVARFSAAAPEVARLTVTVSAGAGTVFTPISSDMERSGTQWIGRITGIPAGHLRQFDATAYDAAGAKLYTGSAVSDIEAGAVAIIAIVLNKPAPPPVENAFPVIDSIAWSRDQVLPGGVVQLVASAHDPDPGDTLTYRWEADCGLFSDASRTSSTWTAPPAEGVCHLTFSVADNHGATTRFSFTLVVTRALGSADVTVSINSWPVVTGVSGNIRIGGSTVEGDLVVSASDPDGDPLSYDWSSTCPGIVINVSPPYGPATPHLTLPPPTATCKVTVAVSDGMVIGGTLATVFLSPVLINQVCLGVSCQVGQICDPVDGLCKANPNGCASVTCSASDLCHVAGVCDPATVTCTTESAKPCPQGQQCNPVDGLCTATCLPACSARACGPDGCGGTCLPGCSGSDTCNASGQCVPPVCVPSCTGKTCGPDGCGGTCLPGCSGSDTCSAGGQCVPAVSGVVAQSANDLRITPPASVAMDSAGSIYVVGSMSTNVDINFNPSGTPINLKSSGGSDAFVARYDATGRILWGATIGDDTATPSVSVPTTQRATGVAVTRDGTMALIGFFSGQVTFGTNALNSPSTVPFIGAIDGSATVPGTPTRKWARSVSLGGSGQLRAIATSPSDQSNRIAVCGVTNIAATDLVPGAVMRGNSNMVIAMLTSAGSLLWSAQLGATNNTNCSAISVDDDGNVVAAGQFDGATLSFPGAKPVTLSSPGTTSNKYLWVARFSGSGSATVPGTPDVLAAVAYNSSANITPVSLTTDSARNVVLAGSFTGDLASMGGSLFNQGSDDAFVAKLAAATLTPVWPAPVQLGSGLLDQARGVGVTSSGDVLAIGSFQDVITAGPTFVSAGYNDIFLLKIDGTSGSIQHAYQYGDGSAQTGDALIVNRSGGDQVLFSTTIAGSTNFGGLVGNVVPVASADAFLVHAKLQ